VSFAPLDAGRVELHRLEEADAEAVAKLAGDWDVARYTARVPHPFSRGAAAAWIARARDDMAGGTGFVFACRRKGEDALIGCAGLSLEPRGGEIGYWIAKAHWGQGYASDAARRLVALAFDTFGLARVRAASHVDNPASARVLEKAGLSALRTEDLAFPARNMVARAHFYGLERDDYGGGHGGGAFPPVVYVGAVALVDEADRVLLARRPEGKAMAGLWEFPGGKVEPGEPARIAVAREMAEELGVEIATAALHPFAIASHRYADFHLLMPLFVCRSWAGEPAPREGQDIAWVAAADLGGHEMPAADTPLVAELRAALATNPDP
jgi:8-oxo-dGTP diphosphatase